MKNYLNCEKYCNVKANVDVKWKDASKKKQKFVNELLLLF